MKSPNSMNKQRDEQLERIIARLETWQNKWALSQRVQDMIREAKSRLIDAARELESDRR